MRPDPADMLQRLVQVLPPGDFAGMTPRPGETGGTLEHGVVLFDLRLPRKGDRRSVAKVYPASTEYDSDYAKQNFNEERLKRKSRNVDDALKLSSPPPVATVFHNEFHDDAHVWVVVQEEVTTLRTIVAKGTQRPEIAREIVRTLAPSQCVGWRHWDLSPDNVGVVNDKDVRLIDLESLIIERDGHLTVTQNFQRYERLPKWIIPKVYGSGLVQPEIVNAKHTWEITLLAAEVATAEPALTHIRAQHKGGFGWSDAWVDAWADAARTRTAPAGSAVFWHRHMSAMAATTNSDEVERIFKELVAVLDTTVGA